MSSPAESKTLRWLPVVMGLVHAGCICITPECGDMCYDDSPLETTCTVVDGVIAFPEDDSIDDVAIGVSEESGCYALRQEGGADSFSLGKTFVQVLCSSDADTGGLRQVALMMPDLRVLEEDARFFEEGDLQIVMETDSGRSCFDITTGTFEVHVKEARGTAAPEPDLVTEDFWRRVVLSLDVQAYTFPTGSPNECAPQVPAFSLMLEFTQSAEDYRRRGRVCG